MADCVDAPGEVLLFASALKELLERVQWVGDDLHEHAGLLCTLSFCAWRATRLLGRAADSQRWEAEYLRLFRGSVQWEVTKGICGSTALWSAGDEDSLTFGSEPEAIFQVLLYLRSSLETAPELVRKRTLEIYDFLRQRLCNRYLDPDLESFLLGESSRILGCVATTVGRCPEVEEWLERAEAYFAQGPNAGPQLARIKYTRQILLYQLSRWDLVCQAAPHLDRTFAEFFMEEDRIKSRILWAASLKVAGRLDEALDILKPLRESRHHVPPGLYGWVLLQCGDIHQISGDHARATDELMEAAQLLREGGQFTGLAQVSAYISLAFRSKGMLKEALRFLESSREDHERLGMKWSVAYYRMLIAETYLAMGRPHDAEVEIRVAIPVFEDQGMVADAVAGVSLLREAIRRQKFDPKAVSDIRDRTRPKR
jgi:tetratricopeptide (TPR) repeat protein